MKKPLNPNENTTLQTFSAHAHDNGILGPRASASIGQRQRGKRDTGNEISLKRAVGSLLVFEIRFL